MNIIAEANAFGAIDVTKVSNRLHTEPIENIFKALLGLNYLDIHKEKILTVVEKRVGYGLNQVDLSVVDLASTAKTRTFYVELSKFLPTRLHREDH